MPRRIAHSEGLVRIAGNYSIEPLVDGWAAWLMLLDPVSSGFYRSHHIAILESYLSSPERHRKALADPRLAGGPFCDLADLPDASIAAWTESYRQLSTQPIRFAQEFAELSNRLTDRRESCHYSDLPASLRG